MSKNSAATRRQVLTGITAALGTALSLPLSSVASTAASAGQRPIYLHGRRVKTVDIHTHWSVDASDLLQGTPLQGRGGPTAAEQYGLSAHRLQDMDRMGIDVQVLSINAYWYDAERDLAASLNDLQNEQLASVCKASSGRFVAIAAVSLQHPELAAQQLETAAKRYGMRGAAIGCSVAGEELSSPRFDPFWSKAQDLDALIFMHPQQSDVATGIANRVRGNGVLGNVIGNPLETTIALSHLIYEGTLDRFPRLKLCAAHGGGYFASYPSRLDHGCLVFPNLCKGGPAPKKHPSEYLHQLYVDSLVFTPEALRHLVANCGAGQIMIGTDYPFPWEDAPIQRVLATQGLRDSERSAILGDTARKLLSLS